MMAKLWDKLLLLLLTGAIIAAIALFEHRQVPAKDTAIASEALLAQRQVDCEVVAVTDGDSLLVNCLNEQIRVRLLGIDAPEMGQVPYGSRAKAALANQLDGQIELQPFGLDYYQRTLAIVYHNHQDINAYLLRQGYAVVYDGDDTPDAYYQAQTQAQTNKLGVWQTAGMQQNPSLWRRYY